MVVSDMLEELGTRVGEPVTKHLDGEIWELRPLKNRFLYAYYKDNKFIMQKGSRSLNWLKYAMSNNLLSHEWRLLSIHHRLTVF